MDTQKGLNLPIARHKWLLWILAVIITLSSAAYQRLTGPTYPVRGKVTVGDTGISFKLLRSETVGKDAAVQIAIADTSITGLVRYKRYKSRDLWTSQQMIHEEGYLTARLPEQPPAGKLMYFVHLGKGNQEVSLTGESPVILRYKGAVPLEVLIPHVLIMFLAMLLSNRTALETLDAGGKIKRYIYWTIGLFFVGGFILGPAVQKYAFDALWTGFPFGFDLTDNKTLIGMLGWLWAWYVNRGNRRARGWVLFAAFLLLLVYLIPHSMMGSEIDYTRVPVTE